MANPTTTPGRIERPPLNLTGKKLELPVKKLMLGQPADKVLNRDAMANPESIDWYIEFARAYAGRGP